jgi:hypothetical protein
VVELPVEPDPPYAGTAPDESVASS